MDSVHGGEFEFEPPPVGIRKLLLAGLLALCPMLPAQGRVQDKPLPRSEPRPSAVTVKQWQRIDNGYSEQIMANAPIPLDEYAATANSFNPTKWDPDAVVALAKAAGMRYIVITSKHHDGFNMFGTAQSQYNVVDGRRITATS